MTSTSPSADNPLRRSSRRRVASNADRRITRRSARLSTNDNLGGDSGDDSLDLSLEPDPLPSPATNKSLKRAHSPYEQESQHSPKARRTTQRGRARDDQNLSGVDTNTSLPARSDEKVKATSTDPKRSVATGFGSTGIAMAAGSFSTDTATKGVAAKETATRRWESLEYTILLEICNYIRNSGERRPNWNLLGLATVCKAFAEPALTALHKSPILTSWNGMQKFADHVSPDSPHNFINYRQKVQELDIDVHVVAWSGTNRTRLGLVVQYLPQLSHIKLRHYKDYSPYRLLDENMRWTYPTELFAALGINSDQELGTRLKSWWWSSRMIHPQETPALREVHASPSFLTLQKLGFINFQLPSMSAGKRADKAKAAEQDQCYIEQITDAISALPNLTHLVMESCTIVDGHFLSLLPHTIQHLELINCWEVTTSHFCHYLSSHGTELRELTLHHNQSLSLGFLPRLAQTCPDLRALRMNFRYFKIHEFYNDCQPYYDWLLYNDQIPTWPQGLEVIELIHLRDWLHPAVDNFFKSLADSAPLLSKLRRLVIKATLDIPWRERSEFRDHWVAKLRDIYLRRSKDPEKFRSLADTPWLDGQETPQRGRRVIATPSRRSTRTVPAHDSTPSSRSNGVSMDLRTQNRPDSYKDPDTDFSESEAEESSPVRKDDAKDPLFVQGMCEVVDIKIDNQKPMERLYAMEDFLDDEPVVRERWPGEPESSDEEWSSDDVSVDEDGYAW